ncbi:type VII secretion target [Rhodococcus gannanensis]|uniref:Type VII secretion target n=1 Tax=Rhodococcus gannanensis TaxID=1960308 RepID=A0ABW4P172_9NOCA
MAEFSAVTEGIRAYGGTATAMASGVRTAAVGTAATGPGVLTPVFGLIGGDFLAAFAAAHASHTAALTALADTLDSMGTAAHATATAYDDADRGVATAVTAAGEGVLA